MVAATPESGSVNQRHLPKRREDLSQSSPRTGKAAAAHSQQGFKDKLPRQIFDRVRSTYVQSRQCVTIIQLSNL